MLNDLDIKQGVLIKAGSSVYKIKPNLRSSWQKNDYIVINEKTGKYVFSGTPLRICRILNEFGAELI